MIDSMRVLVILAFTLLPATARAAVPIETELPLPAPRPNSAGDAECAAQAARVAAESGIPERLRNLAKLYAASCNSKLGYRLYAAEMVQTIRAGSLSPESRRMLDDLKLDLQPEFELRRPVKAWIFPYAGYMSYDPKNAKDHAGTYGVYGGLSVFTWNLALGGEKFRLKGAPGSPAYTQQLLNAVLSKTFGHAWSAKVFATDIKAPSNPSVAGRIYGAGGSMAPFPSTRFDVDLSQSDYPTLTQGPVRAREATLSWTQTLVSEADHTIASRFLSETVMIQARNPTDPATGFRLLPLYHRAAIDLTLYTKRAQVSLSGWTGSEALGVRESGAVVYNALEKHRRGYSGHVQYRWSAALATRISLSREEYQAASGATSATGIVGGVIVYL
ncbi:MAG: hypothetical protein A2V88_07950 [Elusimicrobia bacterium RBG_16_66_12]|nr:MAG: hypothetical protein A2V88_07950 [Elusimicrobia bacterium RBG_16_66_12]